MKHLYKINFIALLLLVFFVPAFGQTNEQIERELVGHIENIKKWSAYGSDYQDELLSKENEIFEEKLLKYTKIASTLDYKFAALDEFMYIAASKDGKFRVFSWDTEEGGTMHFFRNVYQYQGKDGKVHSKSQDLADGDSGGFVYDVFTLDAKGGKIYLVCSLGIGSTKIQHQSISLYKITGDSIEDGVKLFKTKSGLTDSIGFQYDFFSVADRPERPVKLILYDEKANVIKIPVVIEDKEFLDGRVTGKFISYKYNGTYFVKIN